uniref:PHD-type domain-containing protein n=1 Tax=Caenorhabditis tropicalis TaxID=1561998 RepID=A0A1I7V2Z7_9PELO
MSKATDSSIFGKMTTRPAGKRQIKPTAVLYATLNDNQSSDEEDDDFEVNATENGMKTESDGSDSSSGSEDNSDEEESEDDDEDEEKDDAEKPRTPSVEKEMIICGVCINQRNVVAAGDFMQCDKCGIHVHESCYGGLPVEDPEETRWFCEPCQYGLADPPHCEFCPSRFGAFKKADLNGRWTHAICALFAHGVTFLQEHTYTGVSWGSVENSAFGRRQCTACSDKIEARFGIASRCESGMCKEYMHVTCAQKLGLLIDETDDHQGDMTIVVPRYFFCKKHSNQDNLKPFQRKFEQWEKSEGRRITMHRRRQPLDSEANQLRIQMKNTLERTIAEENEKNQKGLVSGVEKAKQARLLNSSTEYFDRFETKAEDSGLSKKEFRDPFYNIKLTNSSHVPIGFSTEYIAFMQIRDSQIIPEEEEKLRKVRELLAEAKAKHEKKAASKHLSDKFAANEELIEKKLESLRALHTLLTELGDGGILSEFTNRQSAERSRGSPALMLPKRKRKLLLCGVANRHQSSINKPNVISATKVTISDV